jgi:phospholipid/cholesterol/gamma-HCH transport system substrate-binding protein
MTISTSVLKWFRSTVVVGFLTVVLLFFAYLWVNFGGDIPGVTGGYQVTAAMSDIQNLQGNADVRVAGIKVGKVRSLRHEGTTVLATLELGKKATPLHEGVSVQLKAKTLLEETYLEVVDGTGPPLEEGTTLPPEAQRPSVQLDDVLNTLDEPARAALSSLVQRLGAATAGRGTDLAAALDGLGTVGRQGHDALDVLAAQNEDLKGLTADADKLLRLLDEGEGRLVSVVDSADRLSQATAGQAGDVQAAIKLLPQVLADARRAAPPLRSMTAALSPLVAPLQAAAPDLNAALLGLRPAVADLRAAVPALDVAFGQAPATLDRAVPVAADVVNLVPALRVTLADLNPMLAYLVPYGIDATALIANLGDALNAVDAEGRHALRVVGLGSEKSNNDMPGRPNEMGPQFSNGYPAPGGSARPVPFSGPVPKVEEERAG